LLRYEVPATRHVEPPFRFTITPSLMIGWTGVRDFAELQVLG